MQHIPKSPWDMGLTYLLTLGSVVDVRGQCRHILYTWSVWEYISIAGIAEESQHGARYG